MMGLGGTGLAMAIMIALLASGCTRLTEPRDYLKGKSPKRARAAECYRLSRL